jgi:hypothetical protein
MKAETVASSGQGVLSIVLALIAAVFVFSVLTNRNVPLGSTTRGALATLAVFGFIMCITGGLAGKVDMAGFSWLSPFVILGIVLGMSAIYVAFAGLTGRSLPFVSGERGALVLLASIIAVKWIMSRVHTLLLG